MNRLLSTILVSIFGLVAVPASAQQPIAPAPEYGQPTAQPQTEVPQYTPPLPPSQEMQGQPVDPYAAYGAQQDDEEEEGSYDVTYDVSTQPDDQQDYDDGYDPNAYQQFESQLSPYGTWEDSGSYGRVWVPSPGIVGGDFAPYDTDGHFTETDYGWTWVSNYDWGWAPFHYGRWMVLGGRGWCWMPGTQWGPAWVNWRFGGGYAGWAPMAPRGVSLGAPRGTRGPWRFTVAAQLGAAHPAYIPARVMPSVWGRTQAIHNVTNVRVGGVGVRINSGPSAAMVAAATGRTISPVPLRSVAPMALPRATIVAHVGTPVASRPWMQSRPIGGSFARPVSNARWIGAAGTGVARPVAMPTNNAYRGNYAATPQYRAPMQQPYRAAQPVQTYHYAQPVYRAPVQTYHYAQPVYRSAAPAYSAPTFHVSSPTYSAPTYSAPTFHVSSPAPAPVSHGGYSGGGMSGGGFHGGGGHAGGHR